MATAAGVLSSSVRKTTFGAASARGTSGARGRPWALSTTASCQLSPSRAKASATEPTWGSTTTRALPSRAASNGAMP